MGTLVCFHAHPDDESIATGGTMVLAKRQGHRVVLVLGTRGEHGEVAEGFLDAGESLGTRRVAETFESAAILGVDRVEFLGYVDSGMMDEPTNDLPYAFWQADLEHAARRMATILEEERPDVFTIYDDHGGYGHPDHIQVHRVGVRAAEIAGVEAVFEATMNRDSIKASIEASRDRIPDESQPDLDEADFDDDFGSPESLITHAIDVSEMLTEKRQSMKAHASQITDDSVFMQLPDDVFMTAFGTEWFIERSSARPEGEALRPSLFG
jgi:LmbE family N-acetylglucosaminyl deacetylase